MDGGSVFINDGRLLVLFSCMTLNSKRVFDSVLMDVCSSLTVGIYVNRGVVEINI